MKQFSAEHGFHFGIAALHGIADYHHIGIGRNIFGAITFHQCDASLFQECRQRGINIIVRTGDSEAALLQRRRNRAHGRSANPEKMKFSRRFFHADSLRRMANFASETKTRVIPSGARDLSLNDASGKPNLNNAAAYVRSSPPQPALSKRSESNGRLRMTDRDRNCYFFLNTSTASQASSGGACSYSSVRSKYILARRSSG